MEEQLELLGLLSEISDMKAACLTAGDIEGLRDAMEKEEELIVALNNAENERIAKADALSQAIGLFSKNVRLKELTAAIPDAALAQKLGRQGEQLSAAVAGLAEKNNRLSELLQLQIDRNDYMLNMLFAPKSKNNAYNVRGTRKDNGDTRGFLDVHI